MQTGKNRIEKKEKTKLQNKYKINEHHHHDELKTFFFFVFQQIIHMSDKNCLKVSVFHWNFKKFHSFWFIVPVKKILCLHGYRQNSQSFKAKSGGFRKVLKNQNLEFGESLKKIVVFADHDFNFNFLKLLSTHHIRYQWVNKIPTMNKIV